MRLIRNSSMLRRERGYMLLILMFFVMMLTFAMMATLPRVAQQVKREREEEMIHRGTEYARAVKKFYKKFNRYPNSLQDLESTNNLRFIRRRYKDPFSKDGNWRLLHITDVQQGISNPNFGLSQAGNFNPAQGGAGQALGGLGALGNQGGGAQGNPSGGFSLGGPPAAPGPDQSQAGTGMSAPGAAGVGTASTNPTDNTSGQTGAAPGMSPPANPAAGGQPGQTYGAGGIVGVASMSKAKSIRVFNQKSNYNKWMFIYDQTQDKGTLLKGPYNPQAFQGGATTGTGANGAPGQPGANSSPFGPNSGQQQQPQQPNNPGNNMPPDLNAPPE
jgi:type II secretory pathway pseudopilin PulG